MSLFGKLGGVTASPVSNAGTTGTTWPNQLPPSYTQGYANQMGMQNAGQFYSSPPPPPPPVRTPNPTPYVSAALQGWLIREASYLFTEGELAAKVWDTAEAMAKEAAKRGY